MPLCAQTRGRSSHPTSSVFIANDGSLRLLGVGSLVALASGLGTMTQIVGVVSHIILGMAEIPSTMWYPCPLKRR